MNAERHPERAFPALLDSMFAVNMTIVESVVTAHGGETTEDALSRIDRDVTSVNADVVVFGFGSNDYFIWGEPPASRVSIERFRYNCRIMFRKLTGTGSAVIVLAPPPVIAARFYQFFDSTLYLAAEGVVALRERYADIVEEVAGEIPGVRLIRCDSSFLADDALLGFDGVHPMPEGHRIIAETLLPVVMEAIEAGRTNPIRIATLEIYPSPFLRYRDGVSVATFPVAETGEFVLFIHDSSGRQIRKIVYYAHTSGNHSVFWNGRSDNGTMVSAGAYTLSLLFSNQPVRMSTILVL